MKMTAKCTECGKTLEEKDRGTLWQELIDGFPSCIECDKKILGRLEKNTKILDRPQMMGHNNHGPEEKI